MAYTIAFFGSKPYDEASFNEKNSEYGFELRYYKGHLHLNNVILTQGVDAVCIFVNDKHEQICKKEGIPCMNVDEITNLNKNKKLIRKLAKKYDAFLASDTLIKKLPRIMGPGLNRAGKFPSVITNSEDPQEKINTLLHTVKFQMKKVLCLSVPVGHVNLTKDQLKSNIVLSCNFLVSLLKKKWQNIKVVYIKSTMGPCQQIYF